MEVDDLLEKVKVIIANRSVREVGDGSIAWPRNDGDKDDTGNDGTLDAVKHEHGGKNTTAKDADPHHGAAHLGIAWANPVNLKLLATAGQFNRGSSGTDNKADTLGVGQTDDGKEETDTDAGGQLNAARDSTSKPLAQAKEGQSKEDETLNEDCRECGLEADMTRTVKADNSVSEVSVQTHTRSDGDGAVSEMSAEVQSMFQASKTYRLEHKPMKKLPKAEIAAVAVIRSRLI